jgi:hypothetical protein
MCKAAISSCAVIQKWSGSILRHLNTDHKWNNYELYRFSQEGNSEDSVKITKGPLTQNAGWHYFTETKSANSGNSGYLRNASGNRRLNSLVLGKRQ